MSALRRHRTGCLTSGLILAGLLTAVGDSRAQENPTVNCVAEKHSETVVNAKTGKAEERANWTARCEIREGQGVIYAKVLTLPYPATRREAMDAIEEFQDKTAPAILKERKKEKKQ